MDYNIGGFYFVLLIMFLFKDNSKFVGMIIYFCRMYRWGGLGVRESIDGGGQIWEQGFWYCDGVFFGLIFGK